MLETYLRKRLESREILLMTHIVIGYPSMEESFQIVKAMVEAGVDLMELQIPFSEPIADGPVILQANQRSLTAGTTLAKCLEFSQQAAGTFDIPFLCMTYYNILFRHGVERFVSAMHSNGLYGAIVPDLPPEEGQAYLQAMQRSGLAPIQIFAPTTSDQRMRYLADHARGFVYCVARKGVTGMETQFSNQLEHYLDRCRRATRLPLALGFGVKSKEDIDFLKGKVDIAVIGTKTLQLIDQAGVAAVHGFIESLR